MQDICNTRCSNSYYITSLYVVVVLCHNRNAVLNVFFMEMVACLLHCFVMVVHFIATICKKNIVSC